jgi:hypothetical protein
VFSVRRAAEDGFGGKLITLKVNARKTMDREKRTALGRLVAPLFGLFIKGINPR